MRTKYLHLVMVMMLVLVAPATITSCLQKAHAQEQVVATSDTLTVAADVPSVADSATAVVSQETSDNLFSWQNILITFLGIFSALFATLWKRARNVIAAIDEALKDGRVDKVELNKILKAWKG